MRDLRRPGPLHLAAPHRQSRAVRPGRAAAPTQALLVLRAGPLPVGPHALRAARRARPGDARQRGTPGHPAPRAPPRPPGPRPGPGRRQPRPAPRLPGPGRVPARGAVARLTARAAAPPVIAAPACRAGPRPGDHHDTPPYASMPSFGATTGGS